MRRFVVLIAILFAFPLRAQTVAIRAGNLIDPATGSVAKNQIILVQDQKIADVGSSVAIPADAQILDLSNEWVMPGIMDSHTHITFLLPNMNTPLDANYLEVSRGMRVLQGLKIAQTLLNAGITTVRDVGNEAGYASVDVRNAINKGWFTGPTILTSGKIIAPFGGQSAGIPPEAGYTWRFEYIDADGPSEIRKAVRQNIFYGADLIKLVSDNSDYFYSEEEIRAAADEAHKAGRALAVHCYKKEEANNVINGGADSLEHGWYLTDDQLRLMKAKGTFLAGTEFPEAHFVQGGYPDAIPVLMRLESAPSCLWHRHQDRVFYRHRHCNARRIPSRHGVGLSRRLAQGGRSAGRCAEGDDYKRRRAPSHSKERGAISYRTFRRHHRHALQPSRRHRSPP